MELEFLVVGIAKGSQEDLHTLYEETNEKVFGMALSIVKDTDLAGQVTAETYRRAVTLAYLFNTDMSAEYWLLDMAKNIATNALHDSVCKEKSLNPKQHNLSKVLLELVNNSKNDRAAIIIARCITNVSKRDIAKLLWYKTGACGKEYTRGINRLSEKVPNIEKSQLEKHIKQDLQSIVPDVWELIIQQEESPLSQISHEELNLDYDEVIYTEHDKEKALEEKHAAQKKRKRSLVIVAIVLALVLVGNLTVLLVTDILKKNSSPTDFQLQTDNKISLVAIDNMVFYQNIQKEDALWVYDKNTKEAKQLLSDPVKDLLVCDSRIYYRNTDNGHMYSVKPDGTDKKLLTDTSGTCLTLYEGKIYFSSSDGIRCINPDGTQEEVVLTIDMNSNEMIYFFDMGLSLYRYSMQFSPEGDLHFSAGAGKGIYYVKDFEQERSAEILYNDEAYTFAITDRYIYFDVKVYNEDNEATIYLYQLDRDGGQFTPVEGFTLGTGAFFIQEGILYFDGTVEKESGLFTYKLESNESPKKFSDLRASSLIPQGDSLYIYYPGDARKPGSYLDYLPIGQLTDKTVSIF